MCQRENRLVDINLEQLNKARLNISLKLNSF